MALCADLGVIVFRAGDDLKNLESLRLSRRTLLCEFVIVHIWNSANGSLVPPTETFVYAAVASTFNLNWYYPRLWLTVLVALEIPVQSR